MELREQCKGRWYVILCALGVDASFLRNKHGPCPGCGGVDRFRYVDEGKGSFFCGRGGDLLCGDGFTLLEHIYGWDFKAAAKEVRRVVGIDEGTPRSIQIPRSPKPEPKASTADYAKRLWNGSSDEQAYLASHPYCQRKAITGAFGARRGYGSGKLVGRDADCLIVPQRTLKDELIGVECINPEGIKQTFGRKGVLVLGNTLDKSLPIYVVEGWADGVATWKHFGNVVVTVVFGIGRQDRVAESLHAKRPNREIVVVRDAPCH